MRLILQLEVWGDYTVVTNNINETVNIIGSIEKISSDEIKKKRLPYMTTATVVSYSAPDAVVTVAGNNGNITVKNLIAGTPVLVEGDEVIIVLLYGSWTNAFIGWKKI